MRPQRKKLLVATVGVAAINYLACQTSDLFTSGNLVSPPHDARADQFVSSGNLVAPVDAGVDGSDASDAALTDADLDGALDGDAGDPDAGDAGDGDIGP